MCLKSILFVDFDRRDKPRILRLYFRGLHPGYEKHSTTEQGRIIRGFEGAQAPPEHTGAHSHCQKHPLKLKGKI